jgi:RHS repeat-associated protein
LSATALGSVRDSYRYNGFAEPEQYQASYNDVTLYDVTYTRDALGRIIGKTENVSGTITLYSYAYDTAGRLTEVRRGGTPIEQYSYDANGNRTSAIVRGVTSSATYDAQDRLLNYGGATYQYTANGELLRKTAGGQTTSYQYDVQGNLTGVTLPDGTAIGYIIDGQNRRIGRTVNGTLVQGWLYADSLNPIAELDGEGNIVSRFVYGSRANVPDYILRNGITYRVITDQLGSPRLVVNIATGVVWQRLDYDAFGNVLGDTRPGLQPFGFAGGLYDPDTGLVRFGARDYDAEVGRWTAKDPIGFAGEDENLYKYVFADPINYIDPTGQIWWLLGGLIGGLVGGGTDLIHQLYQNDWKVDCVDWFSVGANAALGALPLGGYVKYASRPYWRYVGPRSSPHSGWLTRGWGWKPPYGTDYTKAADALQIPTHYVGKINSVQRVDVPFFEYIRGPRLSKKHPGWGGGAGGGIEYHRGGPFPD